MGLALSLEQAGVPTVAFHTHVFARLVKSTVTTHGMPTARQIFVPQPVVGRTAAELRAYIEGIDPISKRPVIQEVIEGLTQPLNDNDLKGLSFDRSTPRLLSPDTEDNLQALFIENKWTDFMPVTLPTEERVVAMLKGTSHPPDKIVGRLRATAFREEWEFNVEQVAVNAVMAGCKPEYFPVVLALAASGMSARSSSTTSWGSISIVNGPIRNEIGMNSGLGALGPYNHANVTIGRAHNLLSINLQGGSVPGDTYMGSTGNPLNYSTCWAEAEEKLPDGWKPFHVQKGFKPDESTVSVFLAGWYMHAGFGPRETWKEKMIRSMQAAEHYSPPLWVMDPIVARGFVDLGYDSKEKLIAWMAENGQLPAREFWDNQWVQTLTLPHAVAGVEPHASKLKAAPDQMVPIWEAKDIHIMVAGGETQGAWKMFSANYRGGTFSIDVWR